MGRRDGGAESEDEEEGEEESGEEAEGEHLVQLEGEERLAGPSRRQGDEVKRAWLRLKEG